MKILHTPRKILFAKNLSLQHTSLPHRIFGKLPFLLEIQTQSLNFKKNKHHITHLLAPMSVCLNQVSLSNNQPEPITSVLYKELETRQLEFYLTVPLVLVA